MALINTSGINPALVIMRHIDDIKKDDTCTTRADQMCKFQIHGHLPFFDLWRHSGSGYQQKVCQKPEFINFTFATATVNGVKLSKMGF
jgi:hypothetical protein